MSAVESVYKVLLERRLRMSALPRAEGRDEGGKIVPKTVYALLRADGSEVMRGTAAEVLEAARLEPVPRDAAGTL